MMCSYYKSIYDIHYQKWAGASINALDSRLKELNIVKHTITSEQAEKHVVNELLDKYLFFRGMTRESIRT